MPKTIKVNKEIYVHDGSDMLNVCPKGTKTRVYTGNFVCVMHNFYPDGTMEFIVFDKNNKHLTKFNREQMNDLLNVMDIVSDQKNDLYPPEFL